MSKTIDHSADVSSGNRHSGSSVFQQVMRTISAVWAVVFLIGFAASVTLSQTVVYNATSSPLPPNLPSVGFQATQTAEFGDYVHLAGSDRILKTVTFTMSDWAKNSEYPLMPAAGWTHPFTINIYNVVPGAPLNTRGAKIATVTQSKLVPWRPEADPTCPGGTAWRAPDTLCYNGLAFNLTFDMSSLGVFLPNDIIVGIAYNTQTWGASPLGVSGPYNSLNVGALGTAVVGSDDSTDRVFWNTSTPGNYTDGGAAGVGVFREDTSWTPNGTINFRVTAGPPDPVVINASYTNPLANPNAWFIYNDENDTVNNALGSLVNGPGTPPIGTGSSQISVTGSQRRNLATYQFSGTPLASISTLKFSTYNPSAGNGGSANRSGYITFNVDFNGSDTFQRRLNYVPSQNGSVIQNTWQEWDAINSGSAQWSYSGPTWPIDGVPGTTLKTWSQILSQYPGVRFRVTDSFFGIRVGEPYTDGYTENIDAIKFGTNAFLKHFNFDVQPPITYVDDNWAGATAGTDPDGAGPATNFGYDAFATVQGGIDGVAVGGTVNVAGGNYLEDVSVNKANLSLLGAGANVTTITGPHNAGGVTTLLIVESGITVDGFTVTRSGNTVAAWGANIKNNGVVFSAPGTGSTLQNCKVTGNRNGIYVGQSSGGNTIRRNVVDFNRTGIHVVDNNANLIEENFITNNWTMGILHRSENAPGTQTITVRNNNITGNWYSDVEYRDPATGGNLNFSGNYFGGAVTRTTTPSGEPGYAAQIPVAYGGAAVAPGSHPSIAGVESAKMDYSPYINNAGDTQAATPGYQGDFSSLTVTADAAQVPPPTSRIQEGIDLITPGGNLVIGNSSYPGSVDVNKALNIKGNFTVGGTFTVSAAGASVSPGLSPGIINTGNLSLTGGSNLNIEINGNIAGFLYDQVNVTGTVSLGGANLVTTLGYTPTAGHTYTIVNNDAGDAVSGTFAGLPEGTVFYLGAYSFRISYVGGTGNDVVLTAVSLCNAVSISTGITSLSGASVNVPVDVDNTTGNALLSTDFTITYNQSVISAPVVSLGSVTAGGVLTVNDSSPGIIQVSIFRSSPFAGAGTLANISFTAVGLPGTSSPVSFGAFKFNEGTQCISTSNGLVTIIGGTITGNVTYGNARAPGPLSRDIPNVLISAAGTPAVSTTTNAFGGYSLSGFGAGNYTRSASKTGGVNGAVTSFDAAKIARHVVNLEPFNGPNQSTVADVSGAGGVSSFDAALIARYVVALPGSGTSGNWIFVPTSYGPSTVYSNISGENYIGLLMGDVTGNWGDPSSYTNPPRPANGYAGARPTLVKAPLMTAAADSEVIVPLKIKGAIGKQIVSYEFELTYDPQVIQPQADAVDRTGTVSRGLVVTTNSDTAGLLRVAVFGSLPISEDGVLVNLKFNAVGPAGSISPLTWERFTLNEGDPQSTVVQGQVELTAADSDQSILNGRLLTAMGEGVSGARVTLTDTTGKTRSILADESGIYRFANVEVGQTYTITVDSKRYTFTPLTVSVASRLTSVDMIAVP